MSQPISGRLRAPLGSGEINDPYFHYFISDRSAKVGFRNHQSRDRSAPYLRIAHLVL
jgi:hypothetical protein